MSVQSPYGTSSWAFWPIGDRYSLTPKWEESHVDYDSTIRPQDEKNRLELVGDYDASTVSFTLQLRDMADPKNPVVPSEEPTITARVEKSYGFAEERVLVAELVQALPAEPEGGYVPGDPVPVPSWNGDVKFTLDSSMRSWLGHGTPAKIIIDAEFPTDAPERIRVGHGTLVLRR